MRVIPLLHIYTYGPTVAACQVKCIAYKDELPAINESSRNIVATPCHNQLVFSTGIAKYVATKLLIRCSETSQGVLRKIIKLLLENRQVY